MNKQSVLFKNPEEELSNPIENKEGEGNEEDEWERYSDTGSYEEYDQPKEIPIEQQFEIKQNKIYTNKQQYSTVQKNAYRIKSSDLDPIDEYDKMGYGYNKYPIKGDNGDYYGNDDYEYNKADNYSYTYDNSDANRGKYDNNFNYKKKYGQYSDNYGHDYKGNQKYHSERNYNNKQDYYKNNYYDSKYSDNSYKTKSEVADDMSTVKNTNEYYGNKKGGFTKQNYSYTAKEENYTYMNTHNTHLQDEQKYTKFDHQNLNYNFHSNKDSRNHYSKTLEDIELNKGDNKSTASNDYTNKNQQYAIKKRYIYDKSDNPYQRKFHSRRDEEPDLIKPVFINSKLVNKDKNAQDAEEDKLIEKKQTSETTTESQNESQSHMSKSIPMYEIISVPVNQIVEKINSAKSQIVEAQKKNTLINDKTLTGSSDSKDQEQCESMKPVVPTQQNPCPSMQMGGMAMPSYPNKNLYSMSLNPYAPNHNHSTIPSQMMIRPMNNMIANYYASNPLIYQQTMRMYNPPSASFDTSEQCEKDLGKLNLNAKEFVPKKKANVIYRYTT